MVQSGGDVRVIVVADGVTSVSGASLATAPGPRGLPLQYWSPDGEESLLSATIQRAMSIVTPDRIYVSVLAEHGPFWQMEQAAFPRVNFVTQPCAKGSGMSVLLPLLHIYRDAPDATVVILSAHQAIEGDANLVDILRQVTDGSIYLDNRILMLGMETSDTSLGLGWIQPAPGPTHTIRNVMDVVMSPTTHRAKRLMEHGSLRNTTVVAARVSALFRLFDRGAHLLLHVFLRSFMRDPNPNNVEALYDVTPDLDVMADLIQASPTLLRVQTLAPTTWFELSHPEHRTKWMRHRLGMAVRRLRERQLLSASELAERADLPTAQLEDLEAGRADVSWSILVQITAGLQLSPEALFRARQPDAKSMRRRSVPILSTWFRSSIRHEPSPVTLSGAEWAAGGMVT